VLELLKKCRVR